MAATPQFVSIPIIGMAQVGVANTNLDGTGATEALVTGATNGTRIEKIAVKAAESTSAGIVRLFIDNGTNTRLLAEIEVTEITPDGTTKSWEGELYFSGGLILPANYTLRVATHHAEMFNVFALGGNF